MLSKRQVRHNIKAMGRRMLKGSWGSALVVVAIPLFVSFAFSTLRTVVALILSIDRFDILWRAPINPTAPHPYTLFNSAIIAVQNLLTIPISFGVTGWFVSLSDGGQPSPLSVFGFLDTFSRYLKTLMVAVSLWIRYTFYTMLALLIPIASVVALFFNAVGRFTAWDSLPNEMRFFSGDISGGTWTMVVLLSLLAFLSASIFYIRYLPVYYLTVRNPDWRVRDIFKTSIRLMRGHRLEAMWFILSFSGWWLLCTLIWIPISALCVFVLPQYILQNVAVLFPYLVSLSVMALEVYMRSCSVLFCEYLEDAALLAAGRSPYGLRADDADTPIEGVPSAAAPVVPRLEGDLDTFFSQTALDRGLDHTVSTNEPNTV